MTEENAAEDARDRMEDFAVCHTWNHQGNSNEDCAQTARELGWDRHRLELAMQSFGYRGECIREILYEFDRGEE